MRSSVGRQSSSKKLVPIVLREPGGSAELDSDEDADAENELRTSQIIFSTGRGFNLQKKLNHISDQRISEMQDTLPGAQESSGDDDHDGKTKIQNVLTSYRP